MKKIAVLVLFICLVPIVNAQEQCLTIKKKNKSIIGLSKKEALYIDHDANDTILVKHWKKITQQDYITDLILLEEAMKKIDPTIPIKTGMTGFPILEKIRANNESHIHKKLDYCSFISAIEQSKNYAMCNLFCYRIASYIKKNSEKKASWHIDQSLIYPTTWQEFLYIDGNYYFPYALQFSKKRTISEIYTAPIISIFDTPVSEYIMQNFKDRPNMKWDYTRKQFYSEYSNHFFPKDYTLENEDGTQKQVAFLTSLGGYFELAALDSDHPVVWYNEDEKLLYLRMPTRSNYNMIFSHSKSRLKDEYLDTLIQKVLQFRGEKIEKMVIDLRFGDYVNMQKLLSYILEKTIYIERDEYILNTPEAIALVSRECEQPINGSKTKEAFGANYLLYRAKTDTLTPDPQSLNYTGNIYFFVDNYTSSKTFYLLTHLKQFPQYKIWGVPNGSLINPIYESVPFILRNTAINDCINPFICFPPKLENFYDGGIDKRIFLTKEQDLLFRTHKGYIFNFDFLKTNDPYLRELLGVEN